MDPKICSNAYKTRRFLDILLILGPNGSEDPGPEMAQTALVLFESSAGFFFSASAASAAICSGFFSHLRAGPKMELNAYETNGFLAILRFLAGLPGPVRIPDLAGFGAPIFSPLRPAQPMAERRHPFFPRSKGYFSRITH